ncbi:MAG TPA: hypothetical protein PKG71_00585 [Candidatus Woesebacteria bacterium]|nr:hypothetical protein [Candidatus Woesebacteria bacterium]
MKAYSLLLVFIGCFALAQYSQSTFAQTVTPAHAASPQGAGHAYITIINQVRGESCCSPGSLTHLTTQLEYAVEYELPTTFVLRYDALTDPRYTQLFLDYRARYPELIRTGVMVEIIPSLVEDAHNKYPISNPKSIEELVYTGTEETWFQAQNAFTIGYSIEERIKIADTLLTKYQEVFGEYPTLSSAWMIDTDTLNYLHDAYDVQVHQITREQWGTDSYTLYGGPPHYPYPASRNWAFIPDFTEPNAVHIIRQTTTDPLYNYGDTTSRFTSQPNDYARGNATTDYFYTLMRNLLLQPHAGFANLRLENSMDEKYQVEFGKQLAFIRKLNNEGVLEVLEPTQAAALFSDRTTTVYTRTEGARSAWWITTATYRVRLTQNENGLTVTDLRIYSNTWEDPYRMRQANHEGYWVVPFLIDGSRWHSHKDISSYPHKFIPVKTDFFTNPTHLTLAPHGSETIITTTPQGQVEVRRDDATLIARFEKESIIFPANAQYHPQTPSQFPARYDSQGDFTWYVDEAPGWGLTRKQCDKTHCTFVPTTNTSVHKQSVISQYPYMYPEAVGRTLSQTYTRVNVHNMFAIATRNPVRLVLEPHDSMNFPILLDAEAEISVSPDDTAITRLGELRKSQQQYVDLDRHNGGQVRVSIRMTQGGESFAQTHTVYFAPNCKNSWQHCARHPVQGVWYVITKIQDWWQGRR